MGFEPGESPDRIALTAWNLMGGRIDWSALPTLVALYGITDVDIFITELAAIRDHLEQKPRGQ